jgi:hypothetical protein
MSPWGFVSSCVNLFGGSRQKASRLNATQVQIDPPSKKPASFPETTASEGPGAIGKGYSFPALCG